MREVAIRTGREEDVNGVLEILHYWSGAQGEEASKQGYLRHVYAADALRESIRRGWCVIAVAGSRVLSVYLIHGGVNAEQVETRRRMVRERVAAGRLPEGRYALTLVSATREGFSGRGYSRATFEKLREQVSGEFDYFVGIGSHDNEATQRSAVRMGWSRVGPVEGGVLGIAATTADAEARLKSFVSDLPYQT